MMARTLIIAEKPAQAREYAAVLGVHSKKQGWLENDRYVITWCVGHLLGLKRPETYMDLQKVGKRWSLRRLPVLPKITEFRWDIKPQTGTQFQVLKRWLQSPDIREVICATDADREGQLLFQEVWDLLRCSKPLKRLWISSLTKEAILEGMAKLRPAEELAGLAAAAYGRAMADWDFGMNLTEGFTSLFGSFDPVRKKPNVISIGRVQTPTLALIVQREWEIEQFKPESYYEVVASFKLAEGGYEGRWYDPAQENKRLTERSIAENIVAKTKGQAGKILQITRKTVTEPPPLLFDLTSLTVAANRRFGHSAEKVLELAQSLYEKKAITYPRTDCPYLPADLIAKLPAHLEAVSTGPYLEIAREAKKLGLPRNKRVINTITAHHAIIPTTEKIGREKLKAEEWDLYDLIVRRFLAVWLKPACFEQTEIITEVTQERFRTKGRVLVSPGWKSVYYFDDIDHDKAESSARAKKRGKKPEEKAAVKSEEETAVKTAKLPPVREGQDLHAEKVKIEEKSTKPPKRFTQGDLLKAMESAGKEIEDEVLRQQLKGKGLGTVATRPAIIENLLQRGYIRQEKKSLCPTPKGCELIALIRDRLPQASMLISAEMTGQLEYDLAQVEKGGLTLEVYMQKVEESVIRILNELRTYEEKFGKTPLSVAPSKTPGKETYRSAEKKTGRAAGKKADKAELKTSKAEPKTSKAEPITSKNEPQAGKKGEGEIAAGGAKRPEAGEFGPCPNCGSPVIEGQKGYGCSNWKSGCKFVVWKTPICGKVLTKAQLKSLLKKGKTPLIKGFKAKSGNRFAAYLVWEDAANGKLRFEFEVQRSKQD